ncbi:MAG: long-chain-fatty-acid--CoA ligase [Candidatus Lindowbacteria bacterium]|nr:long-chain-fatty-acid--CoA ligase [Candidatus Lindowbacteria bacterium]
MDDRTYPEYSSRYPLLLTTFMKRPVRMYPDEVGVVYRNPDTGEFFRFTWFEWYQRTCRLANTLTKTLGIKPGKPGQPGDRIATMALNHHRHLELYYAVPCTGAVLHPINVRLSLDHIVHTIKHAEDRIIFFDDAFLPMIERIYDRIRDTVEKFVYMSDRPVKPATRLEPLHEYEDLIRDCSPGFDWPNLEEDTVATLCYTTATAGTPKGVMFTHRQLYLFSLHTALGRSWNSDPASVHLGESAVTMFNTPLFHIHGWGAPFTSAFAAHKIVLPGRFTVEGFCELAEKEKVTTSGLVPTMLAMIIEYKDLDKYDLSSLKNVSIGGGALPLGLKTKAERMIPGFNALSGYGMTETAPTTITAFVKKSNKNRPKEKLDEIRVKTGVPLPGLDVEVVDENGNPVASDNQTIGEIVIRGPWVMEEYYKDPQKTAEVWRDGWFHTGDMAKIDVDGYITIVDRMSDMIRSGAEMVPTVLLENLTATADFVLESVYVGVPDPKWGERPMAIVKLVPGAEEDENDLLRFLETEGVEKGKIAKWMLPDFIVIANEIPKTSVGKFDKRAIKSRLDKFLSKAKRMHQT